MTARRRTVRLVALAAIVSVFGAACGAGSDAGDESASGSSQAELATETAPVVETAAVESTTTAAPTATTTTTIAPIADTTIPTDTTPVTQPVATEPVVTTAATEPVSTGVPVGYRPVSDDSGQLRANVPAEWVQVDGSPDGELRRLVAAADSEAFLAGYSLPGILLLSGDAPTPDAWVAGLAGGLSAAQADGCTVTETSDYDDGVYTGTEHVLSCGFAETTPHLIGGRDADGELFFLLAIVRPADDLTIRTEIVQSFFVN